MNSNRFDQIDLLYREAVALADRARGWFDGPGIGWRAGLPAAAQAAVATESLATTARLMAAIAWLLDPAHSRQDVCHPDYAFPSDAQRLPPPVLAGTPAMALATESRRLVARVLALTPDMSLPAGSPDTALRVGLPDTASGAAPPSIDALHAPVADIFTTTKGLWRA